MAYPCPQPQQQQSLVPFMGQQQQQPSMPLPMPIHIQGPLLASSSIPLGSQIHPQFQQQFRIFSPFPTATNTQPTMSNQVFVRRTKRAKPQRTLAVPPSKIELSSQFGSRILSTNQ